MVSDKIATLVKFNMSLPITESTSVYTYPLSSNLSQETIKAEETITFYYITAGAKYMLIGGDRRDVFGLYGFAEAGMIIASDKMELSESVPAGYYTSFTEGKQTFANFTIGGGLGADIDFGAGKFWVDVFLALPATEANGVAVAVQIGGVAGIQAGVKFAIL